MNKKIEIQCKICGQSRVVMSRGNTKQKCEQRAPRCRKCWRENCQKTSTQRFWGYVDKKDEKDCWLWTGHKRGPSGYGGFKMYGEKEDYVHRISFELFIGRKIPKGMCVLHHCDTPLCVNPKHLWIGTHLENMKDMDAKGRRANVKGEKNGRSKLSWADIKNIRKIYAEGGAMSSYRKLGKMFKVTTGNIASIIKNRTWMQDQQK